MRVVKGYEAGRKALERGAQRVWDAASPEMLDGIEARFGERLTPRQAVQRILDDVREGGDAAVRRYAEMLDGAAAESLEAPASALRQAYDNTEPELRAALHTAADRIRAFHEACMPKSWMDPATGLGERFTAMARAGVYAPGGQAAYPSTVLMTAVPARVAGVDEVVLATPARHGGGPNPAVLAAAYVAGVDRVFQMGGAQAIAALAYGTESVPKVDIVCGPGNIFVTLAKQMVYGEVAVDGLYGPTETLVIADASVDPAVCAADLLAQAEHDTLASPVFITTDAGTLDSVRAEIDRQLRTLPKRDIATAAVENQGVAVLVDDLDQAVSLANLFGPEHMCLLVEEPGRLLGSIRNAGGVFLGEASPEVAGDYIAGPSHVMPTGGTARFNSSLGVHQFLKVTSVISLDEEVFHALGEDAARLAEAEGLEGHARAARMRLDRTPSSPVRPEPVEGRERKQ
ncbi:MAG: histidinol dehydrogenase [Chloroflexota bacterium]|nr:histidinol dehydrogenase [Chloroflexota bacterium]